jgi:hypothetical protein
MVDAKVNLGIQLSLGDRAPADELDIATRQLRLELLDAGLGDVDLVPANTPENAKGSTGSVLGDLAVAVLPALLPKVFELLMEWKRRRSAERSVKVIAKVDGKPIEVTLSGSGADADAVAQLIERLSDLRPVSR